eukprot:15477417-Alexandrium_andersonii.AAC.1
MPHTHHTSRYGLPNANATHAGVECQTPTPHTPRSTPQRRGKPHSPSPSAEHIGHTPEAGRQRGVQRL